MVNWEAIGAVGEIGGAVAVLVTLIYFARRRPLSSLAGTILDPSDPPAGGGREPHHAPLPLDSRPADRKAAADLQRPAVPCGRNDPVRFLLLLLLLAVGCASPFMAAKADYTSCLRANLESPDACEGYRRIWEAERQAKEIEMSPLARPSSVVVPQE